MKFKIEPKKDYTNLKEYARRNPEPFLSYLTKAAKTGYVCPICGSGSGDNGTGIEHKEDKEGITRFTCFANNCYQWADVIDVMRAIHPSDNYPAIMEKLKDIYKGCPTETKVVKTKKTKREKDKPSIDIPAEINRAQENLGATDYFQTRGISETTVKKFNCGYLADFKTSKTGRPFPAIIIPTFTGLVARGTRKGASYYLPKNCPSSESNVSSLLAPPEVIIVTEGMFDAMSVYEVLGDDVSVISLNSVNNADKFISRLNRLDLENKTIILAFDNDKSGIETGKKIQNEATADITIFSLQGKTNSKDLNEWLLEDRAGFKEALQVFIEEQLAMRTEPLVKDKEAIKTEDSLDPIENRLTPIRSAASLLSDFDEHIKENRKRLAYETGFPQLDDVLGGGLRPQLYVLGALSSLGKTTLALQIVDNLAKKKIDSIVFSLEMSPFELMAKSISRETFIECGKQDVSDTKTTLQVLDGKLDHDRESEVKTLQAARARFKEYGQHVFITAGDDKGNLSPETMREIIAKHIEQTGNIPFVVVDYLQIMPDVNTNVDRRALIDSVVTQCKLITTEFNAPVLLISSLNRDSYNRDIDMSSFKESGGIEYSADVVLGLQIGGSERGPKAKGTHDFAGAIRTVRGESVREMELHILKNRSGQTPADGIPYKFHAKFNYFEEE